MLRFALELQDSLPPEAPDAKSVPASVVDSSVVNNIYGGNILIASNVDTIQQVVSQNVSVGDADALARALSKLGITGEGIKQLEQALSQDAKDGKPTIGAHVKSWLADIGRHLGKEGVKVGVELARKAALKWLQQHTGFEL